MLAIIERENDKLKHLNAGLQTDIDNMSMKIINSNKAHEETLSLFRESQEPLQNVPMVAMLKIHHKTSEKAQLTLCVQLSKKLVK